MTLRPISNPPNPWLSSEVEYLPDEMPEARLEIYEDHTRSILASNDSPDVGFEFSVNPYRGCQHACAYCLSGDTPILMGDATTRLLRDVRAGDVVYGTEPRGDSRRYVRTEVLDHWSTTKLAYRVRLQDGTELVASGDHRFLTARGWKFVVGAERGALQRPHLTTNDKLMGFGALPATPAESDDYKRGYRCGMIRGDALFRVSRYERAGRANGDQYQFRPALADLEALGRARRYLDEISVATHECRLQVATGNGREMTAIRTHARTSFERIRTVIEWPTAPSGEWDRGFLGGVFDAEGSSSQGVLGISNSDGKMIDETVRCLGRFGFECVVEPPAPLAVVAIEPLGVLMPMFDITTGTGDFIANGVVSHNCYARPGHEYLSFGAGTDFDRKIVVKPRAPELLREAFDKKSWNGSLIVFSGVTDCYQPLEASYRLTRG
ncbi:MAG: Radical domain protein, partial [bacterium]|nr:Radical domain protein [bacterium]